MSPSKNTSLPLSKVFIIPPFPHPSIFSINTYSSSVVNAPCNFIANSSEHPHRAAVILAPPSQTSKENRKEKRAITFETSEPASADPKQAEQFASRGTTRSYQTEHVAVMGTIWPWIQERHCLKWGRQVRPLKPGAKQRLLFALCSPPLSTSHQPTSHRHQQPLGRE